MISKDTKISYSLSVVFPVYNEEGSIKEVIISTVDFLKNNSRFNKFEIIAVDDGSKDNTSAILKKLKESFPIKIVTHSRNLGYGKTLMSGVKNSQFPLIFFMDADGQFDIRDLDKLFFYFDQGEEIVTGYREKRQDSLYRIILGKIHTFLIFLLFKLKLKDVNCGFKLIKREVFDVLGFVCSGALAYSDILVNAKNKGLKIKEVPVSHYPCRKGRQTGGSPKIIFRAIKELLELWYRVKIKGKRTKKRDRCK